MPLSDCDLCTTAMIKGDKNNRRAREVELHKELVILLKSYGHKLKFLLFLVDPKIPTQGVLGVLTLALHDDVFIFERTLSRARIDQKTSATTSRYTPNDDLAYNLPQLDSIKRNLKLCYLRKLSSDMEKLKSSGKDALAVDLSKEWGLPDDYDLVCMKATEKKPFITSFAPHPM